jgi:hypothetical protein
MDNTNDSHDPGQENEVWFNVDGEMFKLSVEKLLQIKSSILYEYYMLNREQAKTGNYLYSLKARYHELEYMCSLNCKEFEYQAILLSLRQSTSIYWTGNLSIVTNSIRRSWKIF